jgi:hypothetical protein
MHVLRTLEAIVVSLAISVPGMAQVELFDNFNTGGCGYTDSASFNLQAPAHLNQIQVWYHWRSRESSVRYTIWHDNQVIHEGVLSRAECDPYQEAWCQANDTLDVDAGTGAYTIRTERQRICQNAGSAGAGFVKVFGRFARHEDDYRPDSIHLAADVWHVEEGVNGRSLFIGTWTRRGRSSVFDAVWRNVDTGEEIRDTLRLVEAGDRIVFHRDGNNGEYQGHFSPDARHIEGTTSWYGPGWFWRAEAIGDRR